MIEVSLSHRLEHFALDVEFTAGTGITTVFGRSGAGKTTLINNIAGLATPDRGRIAVDNRVMFDSENGIDVPPERRRLGYVFQEDRLFPHLSVRSNLTYGLELAPRAERRIGFDEVVALLDIDHLLGRRPAALSGGEKQRAAIGRALLANPRLLLMDEPLASLDLARRVEVLRFVERLRDAFRIPILYVSHSIEEITRLADTVIVLSAGRLLAAGPLVEVMNRRDVSVILGAFDAGSVMAATVASHDARYQLTHLRSDAGHLTVSRLDLPIGAALRVRVRARDVILARQRPREISTLNLFHGTVAEIGIAQGPQADVLVDVGTPLWARVTRRSIEELRIEPGTPIYALVKAVAIDREATGLAGATGSGDGPLAVDDQT